MYKYRVSCFNKSVFKWTFCQLLTEKPNCTKILISTISLPITLLSLSLSLTHCVCVCVCVNIYFSLSHSLCVSLSFCFSPCHCVSYYYLSLFLCVHLCVYARHYLFSLSPFSLALSLFLNVLLLIQSLSSLSLLSHFFSFPISLLSNLSLSSCMCD